MMAPITETGSITVRGLTLTDGDIRAALKDLEDEANEAAKAGNGIDWLEFMSHPPLTGTPVKKLTDEEKLCRDKLIARYVAFMYARVWRYSPEKKTITHTSRMGFAGTNKDGKHLANVIVDPNDDKQDNYVETRKYVVETLGCYHADFYHHK